MSRKIVLLSAPILVAATLILFDVEIRPEFSMPRDVEMPDEAQEYRFDGCVDALDKRIHSKTFGNIDNPDVQREILITEKERAISECRALFPEKWLTIDEPFQLNVIDLKYRF